MIEYGSNPPQDSTGQSNPKPGRAHKEFARRCLWLTPAHPEEMKDFDLAYAFEGMARTLALLGDRAAAQQTDAQARQAGDRIADAEDRQIFDGDFAGGKWYGIA
jgi:hypothetical protein